jgi:hypothetical protein
MIDEGLKRVLFPVAVAEIGTMVPVAVVWPSRRGRRGLLPEQSS